jgi:hypothetical protein
MVVSEFRGFKFYANDRGHWGPIQEHGVQVFCILLDVAKAFGFMNDASISTPWSIIPKRNY